MSVPELVDRYTILYLKQENKIDVKEQLIKFRHEVQFKAKVDPKLVDRLYKVNRKMWAIEEWAESGVSLRVMGLLFKRQRMLNKKRVAIKNEIAKQHGEIIEKKSYDGSSNNLS